jgi:PAS domain S-box-containing protein
MNALSGTAKKRNPIFRKKGRASDIDYIFQQAFEHSLQANIISIVGNGSIIRANRAACRLLGYSKKELLTKHREDIFRIREESYKKMLLERTVEGSARADLSIIRKDGKLWPCEITSVIFKDSGGVTNSITSIVDRRERLSVQKKIDVENERSVASNILIALSKNKSQLTVAVVEAKEMERSDIGKELHDNVNQLLGASMLYLDMARKDIKNGEVYLIHSSEYTFAAIEEIRKLTKGLMTDTIKDFGLCAAIEDIARDTMETYPVKIHCKLEPSFERAMSDKFKVNTFRIVQEQLNNILKHASASDIHITMSENKAEFALSITDNGIGFDNTKKLNHTGIGISNIIGRAESYRGKARFITESGKGCKLVITFPVI